MAKNELKMSLDFKPHVKELIEQLNNNLEIMNNLLKENKALLSQFIKSSFKAVKAPLDISQIATRKTDGKTA